MESYVSLAGATYPVLRNGGYLSSPTYYGIGYDNYVVVDAAGIVRYTSVGEVYTSLGRFHDAHVRGGIRESLPSTAVAGATWSALKQLYRGPRSP